MSRKFYITLQIKCLRLLEPKEAACETSYLGPEKTIL